MMQKTSAISIYIIIIISLLLQNGSTSLQVEKKEQPCKWNILPNSPNIYWINMDKSVDRKIAMEKHLNEIVGANKHFRIRGITLNDVYIPSDIKNTWDTNNAKYNTNEIIPPRNEITKNSKFWPYKIILSSLFGRRKINSLKELGCTISHLIAMREAINEPVSTVSTSTGVRTSTGGSKYALIIEDDVQFLFNVDWDALVATGEK